MLIPKTLFYPLLIFVFSLVPFIGYSQEDYVCKQALSIAQQEQQHFVRKQNAFLRQTYIDSNINVVYARMEWRVDPAVLYIRGKVCLYFKVNKNTQNINIHLSDKLKIDTILQHSKVLSYTRSKDLIHIQLEKPLAANELDSISIQYQGTPTSSGFGSITTGSHKGVPIMWTLSEPYGASDWWPCNNNLSDKIDSIDVYITCPKAFTGVSNGLLIENVLINDSTRSTHFKHRYPITSYLVCMAVTNYVRFDTSIALGNKTLPFQTFCYPESELNFRKGSYAAIEAMQLFHQLFGEYPFINEKYGHTEFSWNGGEEHQTNSFVKNTSENLSAHELAHQWFGDKITCASWQDIWLNEGFATFLANLYMESKHPESTISYRKSEVAAVTATANGSVKVDDTSSVNRIFSGQLTYSKGSRLLYMLRLKLGNEAFLKGVQNYLKDSNLAYAYATTADLKRHLEATSKQSLDSFFRQWYEGEGYPSIHLRWVQTGNNSIALKIRQECSHNSVSFFDVAIPIVFKNAQKEQTVIINATAQNELIHVPIDFIADTALIDPEYLIISKNNSSQRLNTVDALVDQPNIVLFPNPTQRLLNIQVKNLNSNKLLVQCIDLQGRVLFEQTQTLFRGNDYFSISTSHLASGTYWLKFIDDKGNVNTLNFQKAP